MKEWVWDSAGSQGDETGANDEMQGLHFGSRHQPVRRRENRKNRSACDKGLSHGLGTPNSKASDARLSRQRAQATSAPDVIVDEEDVECKHSLAWRRRQCHRRRKSEGW
eukprot:1993767-Pleurochrysis_carterae.AAC.1